jgi:hypothetical protein
MIIWTFAANDVRSEQFRPSKGPGQGMHFNEHWINRVYIAYNNSWNGKLTIPIKRQLGDCWFWLIFHSCCLALYYCHNKILCSKASYIILYLSIIELLKHLSILFTNIYWTIEVSKLRNTKLTIKDTATLWWNSSNIGLYATLFYNYTYIQHTGSREISNIPPRHPHFTKMIQLWKILLMWQMALHRAMVNRGI